MLATTELDYPIAAVAPTGSVLPTLTGQVRDAKTIFGVKAFAEMFKMGMAQQSGQELSPDAQKMLNMGIEKAGGGKKGS